MKHPFLHVVMALLAFIACAPPHQNTIDETKTIPVANERLYLAPLNIQANLEALPGWPKDGPHREILMKEFDDVSHRLYSEFLRCEKYGYYKMVDSMSGPTVSIAITLLPFEIKKNMLEIPVRLEVEQRANEHKYTGTLSSNVYFESYSNRPSFLAIGLLLADYGRRFPYQKLVRYFYSPDGGISP